MFKYIMTVGVKLSEPFYGNRKILYRNIGINLYADVSIHIEIYRNTGICIGAPYRGILYRNRSILQYIVTT